MSNLLHLTCFTVVVCFLPVLAKQSTQRHTNPYPTPGCRKRCDLKNFKRKMCLSDFVARVKITKALLSDNEKEPRYLAHIPRKRIFKKPVSFTMIKKNQVIRVHGPAVTCNCKPMEEGKKYLLFGREDIYNRVVYVDNYSIAFEIPSKRSNNVASNIIKRFKREYRSIRCPPKFTRNYGNTNSVIRHK